MTGIDESGLKYITVDELWELGFIQEANRQFWHPHGLAVSVIRNAVNAPGGKFGPVWDCRGDAEGIYFDGQIIQSERWMANAMQVRAEANLHYGARRQLFGLGDNPDPRIVQPLSWRPGQPASHPQLVMTKLELKRNELYERAEEAASMGLSLEDALTAVREGYNSVEADRLAAEDP